MFRRPGGAVPIGTKTNEELKRWARDGLIPDWNATSLADDVFASVLEAIRKSINEEE